MNTFNKILKYIFLFTLLINLTSSCTLFELQPKEWLASNWKGEVCRRDRSGYGEWSKIDKHDCANINITIPKFEKDIQEANLEYKLEENKAGGFRFVSGPLSGDLCSVNLEFKRWKNSIAYFNAIVTKKTDEYEPNPPAGFDPNSSVYIFYRLCTEGQYTLELVRATLRYPPTIRIIFTPKRFRYDKNSQHFEGFATSSDVNHPKFNTN